MLRFLLIILAVTAVLAALLLATAFWLLNDEEFLKAQLGKQALKYTGRELVVSGPLRIELGRETTIHAEGLVFSDADWNTNANMVEVGQLGIRIDIPSLFNDRKPAIPWIQVHDCSIDLLENESGQKNWDVFPPKAEDDADKQNEKPHMPVELGELSIKNCRFSLDTPRRTRQVQAMGQEISLNRNANDRVTGLVVGTVNGEDYRFDGWLEPARAFLQGGPVEHDLQIHFGQVSLQSAGLIADAKTLKGAEIKARFQGPSMEHLLDTLSLPPISEGDFDFRLVLDSSSGGMTRLDVDGDLGSVDLLANGELDRLVKPTAGNVAASLEGPDLEALGMALGIEGLLNAPYLIEAKVNFEGSVVNVVESEVHAAGDLLQVSGTIDTHDGMPDSALDIRLESNEIGRWAPVAGQPAVEWGALSLAGSLAIDSAGLLTIDTGTDFRQSHLEARGSLGPLAGPYQPDLNFSFQSGNPGSLLQLAGIDNFPAEAVHFEGQASYAEKHINISQFALDFAGNHAEVAGVLNLSQKFSGSELDVSLDIRDVAELGRLFGKQDLPAQPLALNGTLKPEGKGLAFDIKQSKLGEIGLSLNGRIADLEKPLGVDAEFDVSLPDLDLLSAALPDIAWPPGAFKAAGRLHNEAELTRLQDVNLELGEIRASITGNLLHDNRFDLQINMQGPDATALAELVGQPLEARPFSLDTGLSGSPEVLTFEKILLTLGKSRVEGDLEIGLGKPVQINGGLHAPYLDLRNWKTEATEEEAPDDKPRSNFVFDDTPILVVRDYGFEADALITIDELDLGNTQLKNIEVGLLLEKNFLELKPLNIRGMGGGSLSGDIRLDGRQATPILNYSLHARDLRSGLGSGVGQDKSTWPAGNFDLVISGQGHTRREVASTLNGKVRVSYGQGLLAMSGFEFLMSDFITELISTLNPFTESSEYTHMECAVMAADIMDGQVEVSPIIFNTDQVTILSQGEIDLVTEKIDLSFNTKARKGIGVSASALINPFIKVGGRLNNPTVELDPAGTVVKGGIAVATVGLSILARSMTDRFLSSKDPCGDALKEIAKRDAESP